MDTLMNSKQGPERPESDAEVHLVVNPAAGAKDGVQVVASLVEPLLRLYEVAYTRHDTMSVGDGERIGKAIATSVNDKELVLIVAGGDGTTHELIQGIRSVFDTRAESVQLVMIPTGTPTHTSAKSAIWLREHEISSKDRLKLYSLCKYLDDEGSCRGLPITVVQTQTAEKAAAAPALASHVVVSTSLHANLLCTAEELRSTIPGVARFKEAAQRNIGTFHSARLRFKPTSEAPVRRWNPGMKRHDIVAADDGGSFQIEGPFSYVLATTLVHSLEPDPPFMIAPLALKTSMLEDEMDVTVIRPLCDPVVLRAIDPGLKSLSADEWDKLEPEAKARAAAVWPERAGSSIGQAYNSGAHVELVYSTDVAEDGSTGAHVKAVHGDERDPVVEVYRCGGWEWTPTASKVGPANTVCIDGAIQVIPAGGSVDVAIVEEKIKFRARC